MAPSVAGFLRFITQVVLSGLAWLAQTVVAVVRSITAAARRVQPGDEGVRAGGYGTFEEWRGDDEETGAPEAAVPNGEASADPMSEIVEGTSKNLIDVLQLDSVLPEAEVDMRSDAYLAAAASAAESVATTTGGAPMRPVVGLKTPKVVKSPAGELSDATKRSLAAVVDAYRR